LRERYSLTLDEGGHEWVIGLLVSLVAVSFSFTALGLAEDYLPQEKRAWRSS
jgi:hypothetical protein